MPLDSSVAFRKIAVLEPCYLCDEQTATHCPCCERALCHDHVPARDWCRDCEEQFAAEILADQQDDRSAVLSVAALTLTGLVMLTTAAPLLLGVGLLGSAGTLGVLRWTSAGRDEQRAGFIERKRARLLLARPEDDSD